MFCTVKHSGIISFANPKYTIMSAPGPRIFYYPAPQPLFFSVSSPSFRARVLWGERGARKHFLTLYFKIIPKWFLNLRGTFVTLMRGFRMLPPYQNPSTNFMFLFSSLQFRLCARTSGLDSQVGRLVREAPSAWPAWPLKRGSPNRCHPNVGLAVTKLPLEAARITK